MANAANTTGFTGCPDHLELWRRKAAEQSAAERLPALFDLLVERFRKVRTGDSSSLRAHYYDGLLAAYALLTGKSEQDISDLVVEAAGRPVA